MIVEYENLSKIKEPVGVVDGCFDPLHRGHILYFEKAKNYGLPLFCNLASDYYIALEKGRVPLLPEWDRATVINGLASISYVHICNTSTQDVLEKINASIYFLGMDWRGKLSNEYAISLRDRRINVVYLDHGKLYSSTNFLEKFVRSSVEVPYVREFEECVRAQENIAYGCCEEHLNVRRGKELIQISDVLKQSFDCTSVLDVGCGHGNFLKLMQERGIKAKGISFSRKHAKSAPKEIQEEITVLDDSSSDYDIKESFDVVVCRNLLSYLTVRQVYQLVRMLASYTSNYLCIHSSFHPFPEHLLDISVDPSEAVEQTLLNKDLLRALFIMEGLKPCYELEEILETKTTTKHPSSYLVFKRQKSNGK